MDDHDLQPLPVNLADLADAMNFRADEFCHYLDTQTGEILFLPDTLHDYPNADEEELLKAFGFIFSDPAEIFLSLRVTSDLDRYLVVDPIDSWEAYRWMEDFARTVEDRDLQRRLDEALQRERPFRGFKDTLFTNERELERWYAYEAAAREEEARMWLAAEGFRAEPPEDN